MGTERPTHASDSLSLPAEGILMSSQPTEDPDLTDEATQQLSALLELMPTLPMPADVSARIIAALDAEAATRTALLGNDADLAATPVPLDKRLLPEAQDVPSATDFDDL